MTFTQVKILVIFIRGFAWIDYQNTEVQKILRDLDSPTIALCERCFENEYSDTRYDVILLENYTIFYKHKNDKDRYVLWVENSEEQVVLLDLKEIQKIKDKVAGIKKWRK